MTNPLRRTSAEALDEFDELGLDSVASVDPTVVPQIAAAKLALMRIAIIPNNEAVIAAFKSKTPLKGRAFSTDGKSFKLFGNTIAKHMKGGIAVSNAGFPTAKTYDSIRALGVNTNIKKGVTTINGKVVDPNSDKFHFISNKDISKERVVLGPKTKQRTTSDEIRSMRKLREQSRESITGSKKGIPLSPTKIQPEDQKKINKITGIKSPLGKPIKAPDSHHLFFKRNQPGLSNNLNNLLPQERLEHAELHRLNAKHINCSPCTLLAMSKLKVAVKIEQIKYAVSEERSADQIIQAFKESGIDTKGANGVFDPTNRKILDATDKADISRIRRLYGGQGRTLGFNSITDTRKGPNKNLNLVQIQLKEIEAAGGIPSLGFDEGSLEAVDIAKGKTDKDVVKKLTDSQRSTGILDDNDKFRVVKNPKFQDNTE